MIYWRDRESGPGWVVSRRSAPSLTRRAARVKTYGEVLREYEQHPESKCADSDGRRCERGTLGLLQPRRVQIDSVTYIGKESNRLEEVEAGLIHAAADVYTVYGDPRRDEWNTKIVPALSKVSLSQFEAATGKSRRLLIDARNGRRRPRASTIAMMRSLVTRLL